MPPVARIFIFKQLYNLRENYLNNQIIVYELYTQLE